MNLKKYTAAEAEFVELTAEDVICTSSFEEPDNGSGDIDL